MRAQRTIDTFRLGPFEACIDPPMLWVNDEHQPHWQPFQIRTLAAFLAQPLLSPDELTDMLKLTDSNPISTKLSHVRNALALSGLPARIVTIKEEGSRAVAAYRLEILT